MAQGLGAFVEGLQGGIKSRNEAEFRQQYTNILRERGGELERGRMGAERTAKAQWSKDQGDPSKFYDQYPQFKPQGDRLMQRFGKYLGGKIKGFFGGAGGEQEGAMQSASFVSPEIQQPQPQAPYGASQPPPQFADGGIAPKKYADGGRVDEDEELFFGGSGADRGFDMGVPSLRDDPDSEMRRAAERAGGAVSSAAAGFGEAETPSEYGRATGDVIGSVGVGAADVALGFGRDVLGPPIEFVGGLLGFDGGGEPPAAGVPTVAAPQGTTGQTDKDVAAGAIDTPDESDAVITEKAMTAGEQQAVENFDYQLLADQGVTPEELPSMNTTDWTDYRREMMQGLMQQGMNPKEAMQQVDYLTVDTQMRGMMRELDKASLYIEAGQSQAAALALRQGFQYFPNGTDVKFGTAVDPVTKRPALMAMGYDEETGEETGSPILITADRLRAMRENMSDPKAFRTWTKDSHQLQLDIAKLGETQKHHTAMEDIYATNAATAARKAEAAAAGGGISGSEERQRDVYYGDQIKELYPDLMYDNPQDVTGLTSAMSKVAKLVPSLAPAEVTHEVMQIYNDPNGGNAGVEALIKSLLERRNTGIPEG